MKKLLYLLLLLPYTTFAVTTVFPGQGGTGTSTLPSQGQLLIGNSIGLYSLNTLTAGSNITITNATNSISISSTASGATPVAVSTSSAETAGQVAYWTSTGASPALLGKVATGTITGTGGITATAGQSVIGSGLTIGCTVASGSAAGCLSSTDWTTFNGKDSFAYPFVVTNGLSATSSLQDLTGGFISTASSTVAGTLQVAGAVQASSSVTVAGTFGASGLSTLGGFVSTASSTVTGTFQASGLSTLFGGFLSSASSTVNGTLVVTGNFTDDSLTTGILQDTSGLLGTITVGSGLVYSGTTLSTASFDSFTHPVITTSATTSLMTTSGGFISTASSTVASNFKVTGELNASSTIAANSLTLTNQLTEIYGGTNQTSYTTGDTLYASASNALSKLAIGTAGQVLMVSNGVPSWAATSSGSGITTLNTLTGATQTFTSNQLISIVSSGTTHNFNGSTTPTFSGLTSTSTLSVGGLSSLTGFISSASSTVAGNFLTSGVLNASSTLDVGGLATLPGGLFDTASSTFTSTADFTSGTVLEHRLLRFNRSTTTAWTGTDTIPIPVDVNKATWVQRVCYTDAGSLNVQFSWGTNNLDMFSATTATSTSSFTTNNAIPALTKMNVAFGTPASSPTVVSCTIDYVSNK